MLFHRKLIGIPGSLLLLLCWINLGLAVNGLRVFDLMSEGDPRVAIEGDVELEVKILRNPARSNYFSTESNVDLDKAHIANAFNCMSAIIITVVVINSQC